MIIKRSHNKGFTLIETFVALTILLSSVSSVLIVVTNGVKLASVTRHQVVSYYLAQEPIEWIRNVRDHNRMVGGVPWLDRIKPACIGVGQKCTLDPRFSTTGAIINAMNFCPGGVCPVIKFDETSGLYGHDTTWDDTIYTRSVEIITPVAGNPEQAIINVTISWKVGLATKNYSIASLIFDW